MKKVLAATAVLALTITTPALAQLDRHQNPSLNSYVRHATETQYQQPTAFGTSDRTVLQVGPLGTGNPSLESFNPNSASSSPTLRQTAPGIAENPSFDWIEQPNIGA